LSALTIDNFRDLKAHHMTQQDIGVVIDASQGDTITIQHIKLADLHAGDFLF
jgi:hypothetical protein